MLIERLLKGETVKFRPHGNSMTPIIKSGQKVTLVPVTEKMILKVGDIVYCKVQGREFLHLISAIKDDHYQISNNHGHINGWTPLKKIYGILIKMELK